MDIHVDYHPSSLEGKEGKINGREERTERRESGGGEGTENRREM